MSGKQVDKTGDAWRITGFFCGHKAQSFNPDYAFFR